MALEKLPVDLPTFEVHPNGRLSGHTLIMRPPSMAAYMALRENKKVPNDVVAGWVVDAVVDDSLDLPDGVRSLDLLTVIGLITPWLEAWEESVLPPASGRRSRKPSPSSP